MSRVYCSMEGRFYPSNQFNGDAHLTQRGSHSRWGSVRDKGGEYVVEGQDPPAWICVDSPSGGPASLKGGAVAAHGD